MAWLARSTHYQTTAVCVLAVLLAGCPGKRVPAPAPAPTVRPPPPTWTPPVRVPRLQVHVLDVNQGSAALIVTPSGKHVVLVDAGPRGAGKGAVVPALDNRQWSFRSIDLMVITHYDADHIGGADELIAAVPVDVLLDHGDHDYWLAEKGVEMAQYDAAMQAEVMPVTFDTTLDGVRIQCLASNNQTPFDRATTAVTPDYSNDNPNSVALLISWEGFELYIAGDQTGSTEARLVGEVPDVDVFIMNHHGSSSRGSNSQDFLYALSPEVAIASMGQHKG